MLLGIGSHDHPRATEPVGVRMTVRNASHRTVLKLGTDREMWQFVKEVQRRTKAPVVFSVPIMTHDYISDLILVMLRLQYECHAEQFPTDGPQDSTHFFATRWIVEPPASVLSSIHAHSTSFMPF